MGDCNVETVRDKDGFCEWHMEMIEGFGCFVI